MLRYFTNFVTALALIFVLVLPATPASADTRDVWVITRDNSGAVSGWDKVVMARYSINIKHKGGKLTEHAMQRDAIPLKYWEQATRISFGGLNFVQFEVYPPEPENPVDTGEEYLITLDCGGDLIYMIAFYERKPMQDFFVLEWGSTRLVTTGHHNPEERIQPWGEVFRHLSQRASDLPIKNCSDSEPVLAIGDLVQRNRQLLAGGERVNN